MQRHLDSLARILTEAESAIPKEEADKQVKVEHCINIKTLCDYEVSCSYGDMVFVICILKDYLKLIADKGGIFGITIGRGLRSWQISYQYRLATIMKNRWRSA